MKVVQVNAVCGFGSTGRICSEISDYLFSVGIENYIFFGSGNSKRTNAERFNTDADKKMHALASRVTGLQAYFSSGATRKGVRIFFCKLSFCGKIYIFQGRAFVLPSYNIS